MGSAHCGYRVFVKKKEKKKSIHFDQRVQEIDCFSIVLMKCTDII